MNNLEQQIFDIIHYEVGVMPSKDQKAVDKIMKLINETVDYVIGEDEDMMIISDVSLEGQKERNDLRKEARAR